MKSLGMRLSVLCIALSCGVLPVWAQGAPAQKLANAPAGTVRVFATAAIREPLESVLPRAVAAIGKPIFVEYGSAGGTLKDEILKGQAFEVALLTPEVNQELFRNGFILPLRYNIASDPVAVGLRGDAKVDVSTPAALKAAILNAKSVKYGQTGAAFPTVKTVIDRLDLAGKFHDTSQINEEVALAPGEYELSFSPVSEILPNKALKNLGPVPADLQVPLVIQAVMGGSRDLKSAQTLIHFLQSQAIDEGLKAAGMKKDIASSSIPAAQ
jgi:molybdate transport system substrate-binding protein